MVEKIIKSVEFNKAQYHPGETVAVTIKVDQRGIGKAAGSRFTMEINDLDKVYFQESCAFPDSDGGRSTPELSSENVIYDQDRGYIQFFWKAPEGMKFAGLGLDISLEKDGIVLDGAAAGFDLVQKWSQAPRYGFLATYGPDKDSGEIEKKLTEMKSLNLNVIQFYDWMYRHHQLLPEADQLEVGEAESEEAGEKTGEKICGKTGIFRDIFNRPLSLQVIREQIAGCRNRGMIPVAYGAVYGAEKEFVKRHGDWIAATRNERGRNSLLDDYTEYIQIMNLAADCPWQGHIIAEFSRAMTELGFMGIHLDQYGFPKTYYSVVAGKRELRDMGREFGQFICAAREELGDRAALIFNAVNNWPVDIVADKPQDVVYIEVWPPHDTFSHLRQLILRARELSHQQKQVILAAYISSLHPDKNKEIPVEAGERAARLTAAAIFANGGFHLMMGEGVSLLTGPYYPDFCQVSPEFRRVIKDYYNVITRYSHYLFSPDLRDSSAYLTGGINTEIIISAGEKRLQIGPDGLQDTIWTIVKENQRCKVLNLVNLLGVSTVNWDSPQYNDPVFQENLEIEWLLDEDIKGIYWVNPDRNDIRADKLDYIRSCHARGETIRFSLPRLEYWGIIIIML